MTLLRTDDMRMTRRGITRAMGSLAALAAALVLALWLVENF